MLLCCLLGDLRCSEADDVWLVILRNEVASYVKGVGVRLYTALRQGNW